MIVNILLNTFLLLYL